MCVSWGGANKGDQKTTISSGLSHLLNQVSYKGTCTFKEQTLFLEGWVNWTTALNYPVVLLNHMRSPVL